MVMNIGDLKFERVGRKSSASVVNKVNMHSHASKDNQLRNNNYELVEHYNRYIQSPECESFIVDISYAFPQITI